MSDQHPQASTGGPTFGTRVAGWLKGTWPALVLIVLALIFIFQNTVSVTLVIFGIQLTGSLWIFTAVILLIGILVGWLLGRNGVRRRKGE